MGNTKETVQKDTKISRRNFLGTAAAAAAFTIVPRHVLGGAGVQAPSDTLNVAGVGIGGQGGSNLRACAGAGANIVALCDCDEKYLTQVGNSYPNAAKYKDFREMLEKQKDIEAVIVATPDHSHAVIAMAAMRRGKHVYVQKPMVKYVWEARMLTEAARKYKVVTQMGNQGHSQSSVKTFEKMVADNVIGDITEAHAWTNRPIWPQGVNMPPQEIPVPEGMNWDLWIGPAPFRPYAQFPDVNNTRGGGMQTYAPFNWRGWWDFGCGALGDMACHVLDCAFSGLKLKYPTNVEACASPVNAQTFPMASIIRFEFPAREGMPPLKLSWYDGGLKPARPALLDNPELRIGTAQSCTIFIGTKGIIRTGEYGDSPTILPRELMQEFQNANPTTTPGRGNFMGAVGSAAAGERTGRGTGGMGGAGGMGGRGMGMGRGMSRMSSHESNWMDACKAGKPADAVSNFDYSGPFTESVVMGCLALKFLDQKLIWDGENMTFTNNANATAYAKPTYREGWSLDM
ncbi:MAG: Gfo/Idh/MocA family oxidoreductase [Sedimentisphaerales bacterium]|nr:Gfo/Idh/MocA family oxidoreductase [Sedimentisphaerales bacterium]